MAKYSENSILDINEDWGLDSRNNLPYSGGKVLEFIKKVLNSKGGDFYFDSETNKYLIFANEQLRVQYLLDRETYSDLILGMFDAPANYTARISLISSSNNMVLSGSTGNYIEFTFDIVDKSNVSVGEPIIATFSFNNAGNIKKVTLIYDSGTTVHFLIDSYLSEGTNTVNISILGRNTLTSAMSIVRYNVVSLKFTSDFDFSKPTIVGLNIGIPYDLEGAGLKYIEWYVDNTLLNTDSIADLKVSRTKYIDTLSFELGKHTLQARAFIENEGDRFYSKTLYYNFVVCPANENWDFPETDILLSFILDDLTPIVINAKLYEKYSYQASVYDSRNRTYSLSISENGTELHSVLTQSKEINNLTYVTSVSGLHTLTFSISENISVEVSFDVEANDVGINEVTDGLELNLSAKGRSNNEANPNTWVDGLVTTTFNDFEWNEQSGWNGDALIIPQGSSIDINFAPLENSVSNGKTIIIDYEASNIEDENSAILNLINSNTNAGILLTASTAKLQSSGGAVINTKYNNGDRVQLAFIINKTTGEYGCLMFIVNNGILERVTNFALTDQFLVTDTLHIGSIGCTTKLYGIKVYNRALTIDEAFCNYAIDSGNLIEIAEKNNILNESTGQIDADKVNSKIPIMIITGDMEPIFLATDKKATTYVDVEYKNLLDPTKNFTATHLRMRPQGTSSLGYPRKNLRLYTSSEFDCIMKDASNQILEDGLYAFKNNSLPVNCWTLKADYAESSGSHNTGIARLWNKFMYDAQINGQYLLRTEALKTALLNNYNYDVRTTIDGFPIVVFYRPNTESPLICLGQYNFNNDKSTEAVFGFRDIPGFDNSNVQCFEFLENPNPICLFSDISEFDTKWDTAFESRYPDTSNPNLVPLKTLATWINSCLNNQEKWNTEKELHFDIYKLAAYYVYLMRFGAVDQTVKNSMITTEDGIHWFFINYDNDTVLGIDNISTVLNAWDYERNTLMPNGLNYYFAGHDSVLWNCFEADPECMALVRTVDSALYTAGLRYENLIQMFDDEQCDKWCERIYNDNGVYKYIKPYKDTGASVLYMLQGSRKSYRHWWLQHRMNMYDAKFASGEFKNKVIRFIAAGAPQGKTFTITSASDTYFGYGINNVEQELGVHVSKNGSYDFITTKNLAIGDPIAIYNASNISSIDLSNFIIYLTTLYVDTAVDNLGKSNLKRLILGDGTNTNNVFSAIGGLSAMTNLEELDIRGFSQITNLGISDLPNLHVFKAVNSGLTSFIPADGVRLTEVSLPSTLQSILLTNARVSNMSYTPTNSLSYVELRNITGSWNVSSFVSTWLNSLSAALILEAQLTWTNINLRRVSLDWLLKIGQIPAAHRNLQGSVTILRLNNVNEYTQLVEAFGSTVFEPTATFRIDVETSSIFISGPTDLVEGQTYQYIATSFPVTETPMLYILFNGITEVSPQTDLQGNVYRTFQRVTLYEATGRVVVTEYNSEINTIVNIKARLQGDSLGIQLNDPSVITVTAKKLIFPTSIILTGNNQFTNTGEYTYTRTFNTDNYNAVLKSIVWSLSDTTYVTIKTQNADEVILNYPALPPATTTITLTCTATFLGINSEVTRTLSMNISLLVIPIASFDYSGPARILETGTYNYYLIDVLPVDYNVGIDYVSASISPLSGNINVSIVGTTIVLDVTELPSDITPSPLDITVVLENETILYQTKNINFGAITGYEAVIVGQGNRDVKLFGKISMITECYIDGYQTTVDSILYNFHDENEHTIKVYVSGSSLLFSGSNIKSCIVGYDLTYVGSSTFANCPNLESIVLSEGITSLEGYSISNCPKLTSVNLPNSLEIILNYALSDCPNLQLLELPPNLTTLGYRFLYNNKIISSITIPASVTSIGLQALCATNLESILVDPQNNTFDSRNNCNAIISTNTNQLIIGCKNTTIPNTVTSIASAAFYECVGLTSILLPETILYINSSAFYRCENLISINLPEILTDISDHCFYYCKSLTSITIPNNVTNISSSAFAWCSSLTTVYLGTGLLTCGNEAFKYSVNIENVYINSLELWCNLIFSAITSNPLYNQANLYVNNLKIENLIIPNTITTLKNFSFTGCKSLKSLVCSDTMTTIGMNTCYLCSNLESITFPTSSLESIGASAFSECNALTTINIPNSVTSLGGSSFYNCLGLTSATLGTGLTTLGSAIFSNCSNLTSVTLSNTITSLGSSTFSSCTSLLSITLPTSLTIIDASLFNRCTNLTSVNISNNVTIIKSLAFYMCSHLASITIPNSVTTIENSAFALSGLTSIIIPDSVTTLADQVFYYANSLTSVTIGNGVTLIGTSTFYPTVECLLRITIGSGVTNIATNAIYGGGLLSEINCYKEIAPTLLSNAIRLGSRAGVVKNLNVPVNATGYDTGLWKSLVLDCGFTLNYVL